MENNSVAKADEVVKEQDRSGYVKPSVLVHKLEDIVRAGGNSGSDFLGTPNSQF